VKSPFFKKIIIIIRKKQKKRHFPGKSFFFVFPLLFKGKKIFFPIFQGLLGLQKTDLVSTAEIIGCVAFKYKEFFFLEISVGKIIKLTWSY